MKGGVGNQVMEILISHNLETILRVVYGSQWESKCLRGEGMPLAQLDAYVSGYADLTGFQRPGR